MAEFKPHCRLYLQFPMHPSAQLVSRLTHAIASTDTASVLLCSDSPQANDDSASLLALVQESGVACLVANDATLAARIGADGVHLPPDTTLYAEARKTLGAESSIGVFCGFSRDDAMRLAESGADYVAFGPEDEGNSDAIDQRAELIAWWSEIFVVPCVAWNVGSVEEAARSAAHGADFVAPPLGLWDDDESPRLIAEIDRAIRASRRTA
ncbi:MAG TPA: thiamine phosphate synthase [Methyloceanibacter sp.]|nr:thiamine phosphate synthase [Methyloceanibacter sp.]